MRLLASLALIAPSVGCARPNHNRNENTSRVNAQTITQPSLSNSNETAPENNQQPKTPDELVRRFYAWYLGELRAGKEPCKSDEKLKQYFTEEFLRQELESELPKSDPILDLPKPESDWYNMKVEVGKPKYYQKKPYYDAYVDVTYKGFTDRGAEVRNGTKFITIVDQWVIGLQRGGAGWRIASISINE